MSFWSSQTLNSRLRNLIAPFNPDQIQSASYELCLGEEVYISALPDTPIKERKKIILGDKETVPIPPGQFAFLITAETIQVPKNALAFISIKFKFKSSGLINVSGFHVDPGYNGKLIFAVYNAGPLNFHVARGERFFSIWYADLDQDDENPRNKIGYDSIPTDLINRPDLVSSLPYLVTRMDDLEKRIENYSVKQAIVFTIAIGILLTLAKPIVDIFTQPLLNIIKSSLPFY
ncbi:deoxycytidine triphosphate deaminase [Calothrix sp. FACHB-1219]|uniref:dCTP deaminase n=1 Tax=unclassified Calothrix TaxID=2619626 RepID=UPI0016870B8C|nr:MULTISPECIES: deoxycytidine triphosphate deaminase [unclassified Calothrix]MBD2204900.1 deoxycytidine triphosphate deaminase [Calothrix sp. FACHB-168]MBD2216274.1 deoxycytidine triphosphate deaminase [Calothrix sp. FACHB-1219]